MSAVVPLPSPAVAAVQCPAPPLVRVADGGDPAGVLRAARASGEPVLAVGAAADGTFRRAVVALDFGAASLRAAALAARLLAPGGTLSLVYVRRAPDDAPAAPAGAELSDGRTVAESLQRLVVALRAGAAPAGRRDLTIGVATLIGDVPAEIVAYADRVGADLVAAGTHAAPLPGVGSVAAAIARLAADGRGDLSVLVCPEGPGPGPGPG